MRRQVLYIYATSRAIRYEAIRQTQTEQPICATDETQANQACSCKGAATLAVPAYEFAAAGEGLRCCFSQRFPQEGRNGGADG